MDITAEVLKDTGLDNVPFEDLSPEQVEMLCNRMVFEIKARMIEFFKGLNAHSLKEHFDLIDESIKDVKKQFEREAKGK